MRVDTLWGFFVCAQILVLVKKPSKSQERDSCSIEKS